MVGTRENDKSKSTCCGIAMKFPLIFIFEKLIL